MDNKFLEVALCILENWINIYIISSFMKPKSKMYQASVIVILTAFALLVNTKIHPLMLFVPVAIMIAYAMINYSSSTIRKLSISIGVFFANLVIAILFTTVLEQNTILLHMVNNDPIFYGGCVMITKMFLLSSFYIIKRNDKNISIDTSWSFVLFCLRTSLISIIYIFYVYTSDRIGGFHILSIIAILVAMLFMIVYFYFLHIYKLKNKISDRTKNHYYTYIDDNSFYTQYIKWMHDIKDDLTVLRKLIPKDNTRVHEILDGMSHRGFTPVRYCEDASLNYVLNHKALVIEDLNKKFQFVIKCDLHSLMNPLDLSLFINNLLDPCIDMADSFIRLQTYSTEETIEIKIAFDADSVKIKHRFQIEEVKNVVDHYHGKFDMLRNDKVYELSIIFKGAENEKNC